MVCVDCCEFLGLHPAEAAGSQQLVDISSFENFCGTTETKASVFGIAEMDARFTVT